jgi:hypothetical protein
MLSKFERLNAWFFSLVSMGLGVYLSGRHPSAGVGLIFLALVMSVLLVGASLYEDARIKGAEKAQKKAEEESEILRARLNTLTERYDRRLDEMERSFKEFQAQTSMRRL